MWIKGQNAKKKLRSDVHMGRGPKWDLVFRGDKSSLNAIKMSAAKAWDGHFGVNTTQKQH